MKPITCLLLVKDFCLFSVTISRKNIKKSETQEQELFNNLICPKNGCLSSTLTFVGYRGGGINVCALQTVSGFLHRGNHRCLDSEVLRIVTVEYMRSIVDCDLFQNYQ